LAAFCPSFHLKKPFRFGEALCLNFCLEALRFSESLCLSFCL